MNQDLHLHVGLKFDQIKTVSHLVLAALMKFLNVWVHTGWKLSAMNVQIISRTIAKGGKNHTGGVTIGRVRSDFIEAWNNRLYPDLTEYADNFEYPRKFYGGSRLRAAPNIPTEITRNRATPGPDPRGNASIRALIKNLGSQMRGGSQVNRRNYFWLN